MALAASGGDTRSAALRGLPSGAAEKYPGTCYSETDYIPACCAPKATLGTVRECSNAPTAHIYPALELVETLFYETGTPAPSWDRYRKLDVAPGSPNGPKGVPIKSTLRCWARSRQWRNSRSIATPWPRSKSMLGKPLATAS